MGGEVTAEDVHALLELADVPETPAALRRGIRSLRPEVDWAPGAVLADLQELARSWVTGLDTYLPNETLYRAVALPTFHRHCTRAEYSAMGFEEFRREVEHTPDPDAFLRSTLNLGHVVFPRDHTWLVAGDHVRHLTGGELVRQLRLARQEPPFALCVLTVARMLHTGVRIRRPHCLDAVIGRHTVWDGAGIPAGQEYVDEDIPAEAVEEVLWRPR